MNRSGSILVFAAVCPALCAAAPVNDSFSSRITLTGSQVTATGTNVAATVQSGENLQNGLFGATVWWSWQAPSNGWVRIDTAGSSFDTVLQISRGASVATQTVVAFNDQKPGWVSDYDSSVTFLATAGTVYNIAVGGWVSQTAPETGTVALQITSGSAAAPPFFPSSLSFTPSEPDVTEANVSVTASFVIEATGAPGSGNAVVGVGAHDPQINPGFGALTSTWNSSQPQSGAPSIPFTLLRYRQGGAQPVWLEIRPDDDAPALYFTGPEGGSGYALPESASVVRSLVVVNDGPVDESPPQLHQVTLSPSGLDVTDAPGSLQISAVLRDSPAGVDYVRVFLLPPSGVQGLSAVLTRNHGQAQDGTWNGVIEVPLRYPSDDYALLIETGDIAGNATSFGLYGEYDMPGGNREVVISGGGAYEEWAYTNWFAPGDSNAGLLDDADGDGRANLLSYAFNRDPHLADGGNGFFPVVELSGSIASQHLRLTFLRNKASANSGLSYTPQFTSDPAGNWQTASPVTVTSQGALWERVVVEDLVTTGSASRRFARVKVDYTAQ